MQIQVRVPFSERLCSKGGRLGRRGACSQERFVSTDGSPAIGDACTPGEGGRTMTGVAGGRRRTRVASAPTGAARSQVGVTSLAQVGGADARSIARAPQ